MDRQDIGMGTLLQYENVAWYSDGAVRILDRRVYPYRKEYVICNTYQEVAQAIRDMVTQSGGPYVAAAMGMALAAHQYREQTEERQMALLEKAAYELAHARPTTSAKMREITGQSLKRAEQAMGSGENVPQALFDEAVTYLNRHYSAYKEIARHLVAQFPRKGTVITQCFAETIVGTMLLECRVTGKDIRFICPETRPFLQGARLTASVITDMGFDVHVITDNMPAYIMNRKKVDVFTSAADVITMDGYVVNKIGTLQIALAAQYWGIPYYVTGTPNRDHAAIDTVVIEERPRSQITDIMGVRVVEKGVKAYYPAFDIVPPKLCNGVVTRKGIFSPFDLYSFFGD